VNSKGISIASAPKPAFTGMKAAGAVRVSPAALDRAAKCVLLRPWPAKNAEVRIDSLEEWEQKAREKIVAVQFDSTAPQRPGGPANSPVGNDGADNKKIDLA
jgi:hypothetical protein